MVLALYLGGSNFQARKPPRRPTRTKKNIQGFLFQRILGTDSRSGSFIDGLETPLFATLCS
jgi:hypothetical protein